MRYPILFAAALTLSAVGATHVNAQAATSGRPGAGAAERRSEMRDKLKGMSPEERKAAIDRAKDRRENRRDNLTDAQKEWLKAQNAELKSTRDAVKAGTLTRESAAQQLKAWREANPRPKAG